MENTEKVLFGDDVPQWYVAFGERWEGPLTASVVYQKVLKKEISWAHYVWRPGKPGWERICDVPEFQVAVPPLPTQNLRQEVKAAARPPVHSSEKSAQKPSVKQGGRAQVVEEEKSGIWFLHDEDTQFGPFRKSEMIGFIQTRRVKGSVFAWCDGMSNWERLETIKVFREFFKAQPPTPPSVRKKEQRDTPRKPLVAKILMAKGDEVVTAICRDISIGGLQVLTDRIPAPVGTSIRMNVSAVGQKLGKTKIEPFVAEGVIVRILEDGRGFSFRFERLTESAKRAIEAYINATS